MSAIDLLRRVKGILTPRYGGTGWKYGVQGVVIPCINNTGSNIDQRAIVQLRHGSQDLRIKPVVDSASRVVFGVAIGYFDNNGYVVYDDVPDGGLAAVQTSGVAEALIDTAVTRGEYAFTSSTDGTITSGATFGAGAFATIIDTADPANGDTYARIALPLLSATSGGGSSGGGSTNGWTLVVDEDGSSLAAWTGASGTWSSDGTYITQTDTTGTPRRAKYNTVVRTAGIVMEAVVNIVTAGTTFAGILLGFDGSSQYGIVVRLQEDANEVEVERENDGSSTIAFAQTVATATDYTLRAVAIGDLVSVYVDSTYIGSVQLAPHSATVSQDYSYVGLYSYGCSAKWKSIKVWTLDLPGEGESALLLE